MLKLIASSAYIARRSERVIISPTGKSQSWLIDLRTAFLDPKAHARICAAILDRLPSDRPIQLAAMETAAIPLLTGLLLQGQASGHNLSGLIIRKERKPTGLGNAVEGTITGDPVILIDDVFNSGDSAEKARVAALCPGPLPVSGERGKWGVGARRMGRPWLPWRRWPA